MNSISRSVFDNRQAIFLINKLTKPQSYLKSVRCIHILSNNCPLISRSTATATSKSCQLGNWIVYTPVRSKYNKKSSKQDDSDDDEDATDLNEFKEGDKSADRNLAQIKIQTLRLDAVIKAGLGLSKNKIEKLFYDSKIRIDGKKITKKSVDVVRECEIDIVKGPSPESEELLQISRIEVLSIDADGLKFQLNIRRHRNLTIEPYENE